MNRRLERHVEKCKAFAEAVRTHFAGLAPFSLYDACCGNGLAGYKLGREPQVLHVVSIDIKEVKLRHKVQERMDVTHLTASIEDVVFTEKPAFVIAVHACGGLTDLLIRKAMQERLPFAIMPCCYSPTMPTYRLANPPPKSKLLYQDGKDYYDAMRRAFIQENGYDAFLERIDQRITPVNNVIIGKPQG